MKKDYKELVSYLVVGVLTTGINYLVYLLLLKSDSWLLANTFSWIVAVLFAYYANKKYVFKSSQKSKKEFFSFVSLRFMTLILETFCLYVFIDLLHIQPMVSKIIVSFITIISNYVLCKFKVFKKEDVCCG